ncbi:MAG: hypothetical protein AAFX87_11045 [Bacteroidota bacterium]
MKKVILVILLSSVCVAYTYSQLSRDPRHVITDAGLIRVTKPPAGVDGDFYLMGEKVDATVFIIGNKVLDAKMNYNLYSNQIILTVDNKDYGLKPSMIDSIVVKQNSRCFINGNGIEGMDKNDFVEKIYSSGKSMLLRKTLADVTKPNYNEQLNVGSRDYTISKKSHYVLFDRKEQKSWKLQGKKKDLKNIKHGQQLNNFVKSKKIKLTDETDLIALIQFYETLN